MSVEDITNYLRVSDQITSSGQPSEEDFRLIAEAGFRAVINLAMPDSDNAIPEEGNIVTKHGMSYHHIAVPFGVPSPDHLSRFICTMESLKDEKVWVHCVVNYRVSAFLYLYGRWKGMPENEAQKAIFDDWEPNETWQEFMAQAIDKLRDNKA